MRVEITDEVVAQLREVLETGDVDDPVNWMGVQGIAWDKGHDELVEFIVAADASTYYEALQRAQREESKA
ncbi:hypothetical protein [Natronomonas sp. EA1]|uniref:hypothetical protein n=1 Tax=Natronomonas sp. EA1 TaxID=3421655 RepID=UPI003EB91BA2